MTRNRSSSSVTRRGWLRTTAGAGAGMALAASAGPARGALGASEKGAEGANHRFLGQHPEYQGDGRRPLPEARRAENRGDCPSDMFQNTKVV